MGRSLLAPGFRFKPTDVELLKYYLKRKLMGRRLHVNVIAEIDIYKYDPWDLPGKSCWESGDLKWYFFCPREKKYQTGNRMKRATEGGFWKVTGKDRSVLFSGEVAGWIKTLVFHTGRAPQGGRTDWVMHEYRLEDQGLADEGVPLDSYVLCIIFQKEGPGPRIGAQYGVPFKEEEWSDDDAEMSCDTVQEANIPQPDLGVMGNFDRQIATNTRSHEEVGRGSRVSALLSPSAVQDAYITQPDLGEMCNFDSRIATNTHSHEDVGIGPSSSCISNLLSPPCKVLQPVSGNYVTAQNHDSNGDDILSMLDCFTEENIFLMNGNGKRSTVEICSQGTPNAIMPESDDVLPNSYEDSYFPDRLGITPYESCTSDAVSPRCHVLPLEASNSLSSEMPLASHGDNILPMFDSSIGESSLYMSQSENNEVAACLEAIPNANMPDPDLILPDPDLVLNSNNAASTLFPGPSFETFRYGDACGVLQEVSYNYGTMEKTRPDANLPVINSFAEANTFPSIDNDENEYRDRSNHLGNADATPLANTRSIYEDLGDLGCLTSEDGYDFSSFLELGDLD